MYVCMYVCMYIEASFINDNGTLFIIFNCNFSSLLVIFLCQDLGGKGNFLLFSAQAPSTFGRRQG